MDNLTIFYLSLLAVVAVWLLQVLRQAYFTSLRSIPGPWYTPFTALPLKLSALAGKRIFYIHDLHQKYGPIVRVGPDEIACASPAGLKEINKVPSFPKSQWYFRQAGQPRHGVFTMVDNRTHQRRRKMLYKGFGQGFLRENWEGRLREQIEAAVMRIEEEAKIHADGEVDCLKWWTCMTADISAMLFFGEPFGMLKTGEEPEFIKVVAKTMQGSIVRADFPWLYEILKRIPTENFGRIFRASSYVLEFATPAVLASKKEGGEANLFATMIANAEKDDEQLDDYDVRIEAANLIIAGSDTTANTLTYLIWAVLQRPALQKALEDEVDKLPADFRDADVEKLPLLGAVIEETLRLYGAAPSTLPRTVPRGGTSLGDSKYFLPEGTTVGCQSYTLHRDPRLFPDPEKFDHTRWLPGAPEFSEDARIAFSPWGGGARICLGIHIAKMELRLATVLFFRRNKGAKVSPSTTPESMEFQNYFLIAPISHRCMIQLKQ
ncbi:cytochrome P450 [Viridothelium virens]|uniref:Cytochrome P450 n=1 Tax=Viridothelium virens TaxID=1048519 RepID=A0A6A6HJT3_VIRVR|nr:cytochrome P450 [Viridothelium virens]